MAYLAGFSALRITQRYFEGKSSFHGMSKGAKEHGETAIIPSSGFIYVVRPAVWCCTANEPDCFCILPFNQIRHSK